LLIELETAQQGTGVVGGKKKNKSQEKVKKAFHFPATYRGGESEGKEVWAGRDIDLHWQNQSLLFTSFSLVEVVRGKEYENQNENWEKLAKWFLAHWLAMTGESEVVGGGSRLCRNFS